MVNAPKKWIIGNWKMHGTAASGRVLAEAVAAHLAASKNPSVEVVICPPVTLLHSLSALIKNSHIKLGAQDCHAQAEGAHTGDISASMLKDAGCNYVILGHSERRAHHAETDALVKQKAEAALRAGLTPIICVGESLQEREQGKAEQAVKNQVAGSVPAAGGCIVAYEPIWAIGSGKTPSGDDIKQMHTYIRGLLDGKCPVIYGGSVKAANARDILHIEHVDGVLVGGASLVAKEFCTIIDAVN